MTDLFTISESGASASSLYSSNRPGRFGHPRPANTRWACFVMPPARTPFAPTASIRPSIAPRRATRGRLNRVPYRCRSRGLPACPSLDGNALLNLRHFRRHALSRTSSRIHLFSLLAEVLMPMLKLGTRCLSRSRAVAPPPSRDIESTKAVV